LTEDFIRAVKIIALTIINFMGPFKTLLDFGNKPYDDTIRHNFDHQSENDGSVILFPVPLLYKLGVLTDFSCVLSNF